MVASPGFPILFFVQQGRKGGGGIPLRRLQKSFLMPTQDKKKGKVYSRYPLPIFFGSGPVENGEFASGQWRHFSPNLGCVRKKTSCLPNQKIGMPSSCFEERRMLIVPAAPEKKEEKEGNCLLAPSFARSKGPTQGTHSHKKEKKKNAIREGVKPKRNCPCRRGKT